MRVGIIDVDGGKRFPNLALMKLARYHKERGDSKVFTFSPDYGFAVNADRVERGGTGYRDYSKQLPAEVDGLQRVMLLSVLPRMRKRVRGFYL